MSYPIVVILLLISSAAYSSVGLGGGTAYLAVLSFWDTDPLLLRPLAWELNIICSIITFWNYFRHGYFSIRISWPYLLGGTVGAIGGASVSIQPLTFKILLALTLSLVSIRMFTQKDSNPLDPKENYTTPPLLISLGLSAIVGGISGLVGIGGGIILGPILLCLHWVEMKHCAAITSSYILLCSIAALITHEASHSSINIQQSILLGSTVLIGGFLGSQFGSGKASPSALRKIFSVITFLAALNIFITLVKTYLLHS